MSTKKKGCRLLQTVRRKGRCGRYIQLHLTNPHTLKRLLRLFEQRRPILSSRPLSSLKYSTKHQMERNTPADPDLSGSADPSPSTGLHVRTQPHDRHRHRGEREREKGRSEQRRRPANQKETGETGMTLIQWRDGDGRAVCN